MKRKIFVLFWGIYKKSLKEKVPLYTQSSRFFFLSSEVIPGQAGTASVTRINRNIKK